MPYHTIHRMEKMGKIGWIITRNDAVCSNGQSEWRDWSRDISSIVDANWSELTIKPRVHPDTNARRSWDRQANKHTDKHSHIIMALVANVTEGAQLTKFLMPTRLFYPAHMQSNATMHPFPPYLFAADDFNASHFHELYFNNFNNYSHYYYSCPSIQMPVGNLISMILYALVCIVGLFGNTLVIYAGN